MRKISKTIKAKKKSILSLLLAAILTFSFNYAPTSIIANQLLMSAAYKSESTQNYYASSQTGTESNISSAQYPTSLAEYFKDSSNNFNILSYYTSRYNDLFGKYLQEYLNKKDTGSTVKVDGVDKKYFELISLFLSSVSATSLYDYYTKNTTSLNSATGAKDFLSYAEHFISHSTEFNYTSNIKVVIPALYPPDSSTDISYLSTFYSDFAKVLLNNPSLEIPSDDGLAEDSDFHTDSISYGHVKKHIDTEIEKTVAIYTYDGATQNKNVMSIFANGAPVSKTYYYKDNSYETLATPNEPFETKSVDQTISSTGRATIKYFFGEQTPGNEGKDIKDQDAYKKAPSTFDISKGISERNKSPLLYREVRPGEDGYIEGFKIYYKYTTVPYEVISGSIYQIYIYNKEGNVTADQKATYDSLFMKVVTEADLDADTNNFYFNVPYTEGADGEVYFRTLLGLNSNAESESYKNFVNLCTNAGKSIIYLKLQPSSTRVIYLKGDQQKLNDLLNTSYSYKNNVTLLPSSDNLEDYYLIPSSSSDYYRSGFDLYFKRIKVNYEDYDYSDAAYEKNKDGSIKYDTTSNPNIPFEQIDVAAADYVCSNEAKNIYTLVPDDYSGTPSLPNPVKASDFEEETKAIKNLYIEVPTSVSEKFANKEYKYYYKHQTQKTNKVYVVDDKADASENNVYKTKNYTVITTKEYNDNFSLYSAVLSTDTNYNKNLKLYYKYDYATFESSTTGVYVKNLLRKNLTTSTTNKNAENAIYIIDDSLSSSERSNYRALNYTVITTKEYNLNASFYSQIADNDPNYSKTYTKLYYKYNEDSTVSKKVVYLYSSSTSSTYKTFYRTDSDYIAGDYELIPATDENYVEGLELYYKKIRNVNAPKVPSDPQKTYYYYQTNSGVSLKAKSFYMISFYVYTNDATASVYVTDSNNVMTDIKIENLSTNQKWQKYCLFIATDSLAASSVTIKFYMGDNNSIAGNTSNTSVTGTILFDDVKITKINETDFATRSVDGKAVGPEDANKNQVFVVNDETSFSGVALDFRTKTDIELSDKSGTKFNSLVDFDTNSDAYALLNGLTFTDGTDGYSPYSSLWQYYISRDVSTQENEFLLPELQNAYKNGEAKVSVVEEASIFADKTKNGDKDDEDKDSSDDKKDDDKKDEDDVKYVESTFNSSNRILKIENSNSLNALGVVSKNFVLKQSMYYKITVWVYSPDKDAKAVVDVVSNLKTNSTTSKSSVLSVSATVDANISAYTTTPTNEYGWIPVSIFVEGNALHNQDCSLVLRAYNSSTVYFDNITIETTTSSSYDTANSDSDNTTYCLSLTPSSSVIARGVTNGYFNNVNVTNNYKEIDSSLPRTPKNWTVETTNSSNVVAGVVPTSTDYMALPKEQNFFKKYEVDIPSNHTINTNIFAIHSTGKLDSTILDGTASVDATSVYKIYSSSISLSASNTYQISFEFAKTADFVKTFGKTPRMVANLYYGSVDSKKIISSFSIDADDPMIADNLWHKYTFNVATGTSSATVYLEIGVENAVGTCFFQKASSVTTTDSLDKIRDDLLQNDGEYKVETIENSRFVNLANSKFSILGEETSNKNLYESNEYTSDSTDTTSYTTGKSGVVVADYYTFDTTYKYTVTIDKVEYYLKEFKDEATGKISYKLFSDSNYKNEVTKIGGKLVTINSNNVVSVGQNASKTDYDTTKTEVRNYTYSFDENADKDAILTVNDVLIEKSELKNTHSQNVLVLANSNSTDCTIVTPVYSNSLKTSAFYALKVYVKTSGFENDEYGLNIAVNALSNTWNNINTTKVESKSKDADGFVCYQILITTNTSSISNLSVSFSLGTEKATGTGYALIAGVELENFATEKLFNEYAENFEDDEITTKKYFGKTSSDKKDDETKKNEESSAWATFFYIFSSILLGVATIVAIVATIIKKHPIKINKVESSNKDKNSEGITISNTSKSDSNETVKTKTKKTIKTKSKSTSNHDDEGFV